MGVVSGPGSPGPRPGGDADGLNGSCHWRARLARNIRSSSSFETKTVSSSLTRVPDRAIPDRRKVLPNDLLVEVVKRRLRRRERLHGGPGTVGDRFEGVGQCASSNATGGLAARSSAASLLTHPKSALHAAPANMTPTGITRNITTAMTIAPGTGRNYHPSSDRQRVRPAAGPGGSVQRASARAAAVVRAGQASGRTAS